MAKKKNLILGYDISDESQKQELMDKFVAELEEGKTVKEALQVPDRQLDAVYALAYRKYNQGAYKEAADLFRYLLTFDPEKYDYVLGLAACLHRDGNHDQAAMSYIYASVLEPDDPVPFFHGAECMLQIGLSEMAVAGYEMAIKAAKGREEYNELVARAELTSKALKDKRPINKES